MSYSVVDEVTADCLEVGDVIYIDTHQDFYWAYMLIDEIVDDVFSITVRGHDLDAEEDYVIEFDPDDRLELYMEIDDED